MNMRGARRIQPQMPSQNYQTFQVASPLSTHYKPATCKEIDCPNYLNGWRIRVEGLPEDMLHLAKHSGRRFREVSIKEGETYLVFEGGQKCFQESTHRTSLQRPEFYFIGQGDWRSYSSRNAERVSTEEWLDRFRTNQDSLATQLERG